MKCKCLNAFLAAMLRLCCGDVDDSDTDSSVSSPTIARIITPQASRDEVKSQDYAGLRAVQRVRPAAVEYTCLNNTDRQQSPKEKKVTNRRSGKKVLVSSLMRFKIPVANWQRDRRPTITGTSLDWMWSEHATDDYDIFDNPKSYDQPAPKLMPMICAIKVYREGATFPVRLNGRERIQANQLRCATLEEQKQWLQEFLIKTWKEELFDGITKVDCVYSDYKILSFELPDSRSQIWKSKLIAAVKKQESAQSRP